MKRVENAGEGGNEKAFEMLSDFWSDLSLHLPCILPFCSFGSERLAAQLCLFGGMFIISAHSTCSFMIHMIHALL